MQLENILLNLSYIIILLALLLRDMLFLRLLLIMAQICMISYAITVSNDAILTWNCVFICINTFHFTRLMLERRPIHLSEELQYFYETDFPHLSKREFLTFWNFGKELHKDKDAVFIRDGDVQQEIMLLIEGEARSDHDQDEDGENDMFHRGQFIAISSYLSSEATHGTVTATTECRFITWNRNKLEQLKDLNPNLMVKLHETVGKKFASRVHFNIKKNFERESQRKSASGHILMRDSTTGRVYPMSIKDKSDHGMCCVYVGAHDAPEVRSVLTSVNAKEKAEYEVRWRRDLAEEIYSFGLKLDSDKAPDTQE